MYLPTFKGLKLRDQSNNNDADITDIWEHEQRNKYYRLMYNLINDENTEDQVHNVVFNKNRNS